MSNKIPLYPKNLKYQKVTEIQECWLIMEPTHVQIYYRFKAEEPIDQEKEYLGWKEYDNVFTTIVLKEKISGIEMNYLKDDNLWGIYIIVTGFGVDIKMPFKEEKSAIKIFDLLMEYITK